MTSILKVDTIQNSSGTDALSIDSSGNLTASGYIRNTPIAFKVYMENSITGTNISVEAEGHTIPCNLTAFDYGSNYTTTGYKFVVPIDGLYQFVTRVNFSDAPSASWISTYLQVNDAIEPSTRTLTKGLDYQTENNVDLLELTAGDIVRLVVKSHTSDTSVTIRGGGETFFSGYLLG